MFGVAKYIYLNLNLKHMRQTKFELRLILAVFRNIFHGFKILAAETYF